MQDNNSSSLNEEENNILLISQHIHKNDEIKLNERHDYKKLSFNEAYVVMKNKIDTTAGSYTDDVDVHNDANTAIHIKSIQANATIPPDGGWGWVVVAASFCCNLAVDGIIYSFGIFLPILVEKLGSSKAKVSLIGSLLSGSYLAAGPFVSALANRYGFRMITIVGAVLSCIAFFISSFATDVEFLYITYGILGGIGFGLIFVPAVIVIGFYFEKWRALATGIAVCGSGVGTFIMAPLSAWLIEQYTWKHAMIIQAGFILNCAVFGSLFRPLQQISAEVPKAMTHTIATVLDISLMKSVTFIILALSGFLTSMGMYTPFMYINDRAIKLNINESSAIWLISVLGIANTIGRVGFGLLISIPNTNAVLINNISLTLCGACTMFSGLFPYVEYQFFYASIFGLTIACFSSLRTIIIVDLLGLEKLTNAFGLLLLFQGIAAVVGPPLAGYSVDITGSYDLSFYISGALIIISAAICYPIEMINKSEKKQT